MNDEYCHILLDILECEQSKSISISPIPNTPHLDLCPESIDMFSDFDS